MNVNAEPHNHELERKAKMIKNLLLACATVAGSYWRRIADDSATTTPPRDPTAVWIDLQKDVVLLHNRLGRPGRQEFRGPSVQSPFSCLNGNGLPSAS
jgi:hypothetical protein